MPTAQINGINIAYEIIGDAGGRPWVLTPGGRFSKDSAGVHELAEELAANGQRVLIWDRPNCGASDVHFSGASESVMQADTLGALLKELDMTPAIIAGGSGGARVSMLTAARHRDLAAGLAIWWISGGVMGLMVLGTHYCGENIKIVWNEGMEGVANLPEWQETIGMNPSNRQRILDQDPMEFKTTMERWMAAYCPNDAELVPGLADSDAKQLNGLPTLVFRGGESDYNHPRETSEKVAAGIEGAQLVEPPWGDREWIERGEQRNSGVTKGLFVRWHLLAPQLLDWSAKIPV